MGPNEGEFFAAAVIRGSTTVSVRVGNRGLRLANVNGVWVLPVVQGMVPAIEVFNGSEEPVAVPILLGRGSHSMNIWVGGASNANDVSTHRMWGIDAGTLGIFGALMLEEQSGMPLVVHCRGTADYHFAGPGCPNTIQVYRRRLVNAGSGLAPTQKYPKLFHKNTDLIVSVPHSTPGTAEYGSAERVAELVLMGRDDLPANHRLEAETNGWEWEFPAEGEE